MATDECCQAKTKSQTDRGPCRICFEQGGEQIAPCKCKGSSKWIHRDCLNRWRVSGSNPRALTNCCECGFQYVLKIDTEVSCTERDERKRQLFHRLATQTVLWFLGVQVVIIGFGILICAVDSEGYMTKAFGSEQETAERILERLDSHKLAYYVAGLLASCMLVGIFVCFVGCFGPCIRQPGPTGECLECGVCLDCGSACATSSVDMFICRGACLESLGFDCSALVSAIGGESIVLFCTLVLVALILIGILAALVALVVFVQRAVQEYAKIQEIKLLAEEYVVQDLADIDPKDCAERQESLQAQISQDIESVFGRRYVLGRSYGGTVA